MKTCSGAAKSDLKSGRQFFPVQEAVREWLFSLPLIAGRQAQIIILEILQGISVVIIFAFLDLGKNISFSDSLLGGIVFAQALNVRYQAL
jgi:hypothetical protein